MAKQLTKRQHTVLETIRLWIREHGYPPTIRELGRHLGIKSLRGVTTHLDAIAKKGFLKREPRARSISLLDVVAPFERALRVPVVGRIRAGSPILAQEQVEGHVVVDGGWLGVSSASAESPQHFALKVQGDSMITAGILSGDYVIVRQQPTAENGDIVVALLGDEATVKRFFKDEEQIRLQPEHPTMEPLIVSSGQPLTILGKVVAVFRQVS
ncbi:MAG: transcriptional repressor LexA [Candidatus Omnitrophica bacterium]|nr:transcriptional repressor LexA [Candidatus Omnitrophota bacterium]MBI3083512.1 transcriptional repressor LexA [Candidatus Omnitrophota bacterium]